MPGLRFVFLGLVVAFSLCAATELSAAEPVGLPGIDLGSLKAVLLDETQAKLEGTWKASTSTRPFVGVGYLTDNNEGKGEKSARFTARLPADGEYEVFLAYSAGSNRATNVLVTVTAANGAQEQRVNQQKHVGGLAPFTSLGTFPFQAGDDAVVLVSNAGADQYTLVDAVLFLPVAAREKFSQALAANPLSKAPPIAVKAPEKPAAAPPPPPTPFVRTPPPDLPKPLTSAQLDALLFAAVPGAKDTPPCDDDTFLRRVTLDLVGRPPTPAEREAYLAAGAAERRAQAVDRLLGDAGLGRNWANYWSDVISHQVNPPELTFLKYNLFKGWLAAEFNRDAGWDEMAYRILTVNGKVASRPEATFIGFHSGEPVSLANETARVFLGVQINCAQCHLHPFDRWKQEEFHSFAAFFARVSAKISQNDSSGIEVGGKPAGEMNLAKTSLHKGGPIAPAVFDGETLELGLADQVRREKLAQWVVGPQNPWFARSYVNHVWARLLGQGFYDPVDNLSDAIAPAAPEAHQALAASFIAGGHQTKGLLRTIALSSAYGRQRSADGGPGERPFTAAVTGKLRGDEVFDSLATVIGLPNQVGQQAKPTGAIRFPPPPKSTRDLVNEAFGFDPTRSPSERSRTLKQAMLLMNNDQVQAQINARPESGTWLAKLLTDEPDDRRAVEKLFLNVLARPAREQEAAIALDHLRTVGVRGEAFEDLLWGLLNAAEFTTRP